MKEELLKQVESKFTEDSKIIWATKNHLELLLSQVESCQAFSERYQQHNSEGQMLSLLNQLLHRLTELDSAVADTSVIFSSTIPLTDFKKSFLNLSSLGTLSVAKDATFTQGSLQKTAEIYKDKKTTLVYILNEPIAQLVTWECKYGRNDIMTSTCPVVVASDNRLEMEFIPTVSGMYSFQLIPTGCPIIGVQKFTLTVYNIYPTSCNTITAFSDDLQDLEVVSYVEAAAMMEDCTPTTGELMVDINSQTCAQESIECKDNWSYIEQETTLQESKEMLTYEQHSTLDTYNCESNLETKASKSREVESGRSYGSRLIFEENPAHTKSSYDKESSTPDTSVHYNDSETKVSKTKEDESECSYGYGLTLEETLAFTKSNYGKERSSLTKSSYDSTKHSTSVWSMLLSLSAPNYGTDPPVYSSPPIPSSYRKPITIGARMKRGPDWKYGNQDGGAGNLGTVVHHSTRSGCDFFVKWDGQTIQYRYRWGSQNKYDLELV